MDSGWIYCDNVTTLIGVNEAGKSNLLLALWKLNPAKGGEINFADDMPVKLFSELRGSSNKPKFIQAVFEITSYSVLNSIAVKSGYDKEDIKIVQVSRDYDGQRYIYFPNALAYTSIPQIDILTFLQEHSNKISQLSEAGKTETGIKAEAEQKFSLAMKLIAEKTTLNKSDVVSVSDCFKSITSKEMQTSTIRPILTEIYNYFCKILKNFDKPNPSSFEENRKTIIDNMPKFVYYSN